MSEFCFIILHSHGELTSNAVLIPENKTIIKKNLAPCGAIALADIRPNRLYDIEDLKEKKAEEDEEEEKSEEEKSEEEKNNENLLNFYYNLERIKKKLIEVDDIGMCIPYDEYKDICFYHFKEVSCSEGLYKNACMVLTDKTKYLMRKYKSENIDTDKIIIMIKNPDIMDRPDGTRKYEDYIQYNLFDPKETWNLLNIYHPTWKSNLDLVNKIHNIMLTAYINPPDWIESDRIDEDNPYNHMIRSDNLNTQILFDIIEILPQPIIKMLDMTCSQIDVKDAVNVFTKLNQSKYKYKSKKPVDDFGWGLKNKLKHRTRKNKNNKRHKTKKNSIYKRKRARGRSTKKR